MIRKTIIAAELHPAQWPAGVTSGNGTIVFDSLLTSGGPDSLNPQKGAKFVGICHRRGETEKFQFGPVDRMEIDD